MAVAQDAHLQLSMVNGVFTDRVDMEDRGFAYGDGLFESMLCVGGKIPLLKWHLQRLLSGCKVLCLPVDEQRVRRELGVFLARAALGSAEHGKVKLMLTRGQSGRASYPYPHISAENAPNIRSSSLFFQLTRLNPADDVSGLRLVSAKTPLISPPALVGLKHLSRMPYILAALGTRLQENEELMFVDEDGYIVETMHHNIFFLQRDRLVSPSLNKVGVAGVARAILLEQVASSVGLGVTLKNIRQNELGDFEACFIANAVRGLSAVEAIDAHVFLGSENFYKAANGFAKFLEAHR